MPISSARTVRRKRAVESFRHAADCLAPIEHDMSVFAITRGQFSMIDAVLAVLDKAGPSHVSIWTWRIADYEIKVIERLLGDGRLLSARLVIDLSAGWDPDSWSGKIVTRWVEMFGEASVRTVINHAKIATVYNDEWKFCLRGSMNLNHNPRFEQLDVDEGSGADGGRPTAFDVVHQLEDELPDIGALPSKPQAVAASKIKDAWNPGQLNMFDGGKTWAK